MDLDNDERLSKQEMLEAFITGSQMFSRYKEKFQAMVDEAARLHDADADGYLSLEEFKSYLSGTRDEL